MNKESHFLRNTDRGSNWAENLKLVDNLNRDTALISVEIPNQNILLWKIALPWKYTHLTENACTARGVTAEMHENETFALHRIHVRRNFQLFIS